MPDESLAASFSIDNRALVILKISQSFQCFYWTTTDSSSTLMMFYGGKTSRTIRSKHHF
jgi:hypothetical protein